MRSSPQIHHYLVLNFHGFYGLSLNRTDADYNTGQYSSMLVLGLKIECNDELKRFYSNHPLITATSDYNLRNK